MEMEEGLFLLIVEPYREMRTLLQQFFSRQQVAAQAVTSVAAAMASLAQRPVRVVLTDLFLPDAAGIALVRHVRHVAPGTRVIVMGAFTAPATQQQAIAAGASAFLEKPFSLAHLEAVVRHALQDGRGQ
jgi:DNA-binding NtrC family response regulator